MDYLMEVIAVTTYLTLGGGLALTGEFHYYFSGRRHRMSGLYLNFCLTFMSGKLVMRIYRVKQTLYWWMSCLACVLFWPYQIVRERATRRLYKAAEEEEARKPAIPWIFSARMDNLIRQYTIEEAEAEHTSRDAATRAQSVPFGFANWKWRMLKESMQPWDELWSYSVYWGPLASNSGFALVRNGVVVRELILVES